MNELDSGLNYMAFAAEWMSACKPSSPQNPKTTAESIPSFLNRKMGQRNLSTAQLFEAAHAERSTGYKIMNGQLLPGRNSLLRVAIVLCLDVNEAQYLLQIGKRAGLSPTNRRDAVILYCLIKRLSLSEANLVLLQAGEDTL